MLSVWLCRPVSAWASPGRSLWLDLPGVCMLRRGELGFGALAGWLGGVRDDAQGGARHCVKGGSAATRRLCM